MVNRRYVKTTYKVRNALLYDFSVTPELMKLATSACLANTVIITLSVKQTLNK